jgi:type I restriction enzyme M protein
MKGLEATSIPKSKLSRDFRCEAEFFRKRYLAEDSALDRISSIPIGNFAEVTDGQHGYHVIDEESQIAMLTAKNAIGWFSDREGADTIAKETHEANLRSSLESDDIILSTRGTVGACAIVLPETPPANLDQDVARISWKSRREFLPEFVLAYLNSTFGQDHIQRYASGMIQQGLSLQKVREIHIPLLSIAFQGQVRNIVKSAIQSRSRQKIEMNRAETQMLESIGLTGWNPPEALTYAARASEALAANRVDAEYFQPAKKATIKHLNALPGSPLCEHYKAIRQMFDPVKAGKQETVRNFDLSDALQPVLDDEAPTIPASEVGSTKKRFEAGDVVISRLRAYLREIALVRTSSSIPAVGSSEFIVLRPIQADRPPLSRAVLLVFLRSHPVQTILRWSQDGSHHPRFGEEDLMCIRVPDAVCAAAPKVEKLFEEVLSARTQARTLLAKAKRAVEIAIEESEAAALKYLSN